MCGIVGIWNRDGRPVDVEALQRGADSIRHRGPDDEGYVLINTRTGESAACAGRESDSALNLPDLRALAGEPFDLAFGFRRLAILDLSPAGHQPMSSSDGRYWMVFNGEVYNYRDIRAELRSLGHDFHSGTDSEVILAAFQQWGPDCQRRFNGMWAAAIWDQERRRLFLTRDRFGIKPLYYVDSADSGTFAFGSEIKALLAAGAATFEPDRRAVARFIALDQYPSQSEGRTFFEGIRSLPPANQAVITPHSTEISRYWTLPPPDSAPPNERKLLEEYAELFKDSVRLHLQSDRVVGTCLSGGVDSSSLVATIADLMGESNGCAASLGERQQTFSSVYEDSGPWNERRHIDTILGSVGAAGRFVVPTLDRLWGDLDDLVWHQEEPFDSASMFAQWCVMDLAQQHGVRVVLDGQGADEVLGGYPPALSTHLGELLSRGKLAQAIRFGGHVRSVKGTDSGPLISRAVRKHLRLSALGRMMSRSRSGFRNMVEGSCLSDSAAGLLSEEDFSSHPFIDRIPTLSESLAHILQEELLPQLLRFEDRNSMAFSIEGRVPYLDARLVEFMFGRGHSLRVKDGWTKWIHRSVFNGRLPDEIVWRRDKVAFATPQASWMQASSLEIESILTDSALSEYLDSKQLDGSIAAGSGLQWRWISVAKWLRVFADRTPSQNDPVPVLSV